MRLLLLRYAAHVGFGLLEGRSLQGLWAREVFFCGSPLGNWGADSVVTPPFGCSGETGGC
jgi:hypothetical protein